MKFIIIILFVFMNYSFGEQSKDLNNSEMEIINISKVLKLYADGLMAHTDLPKYNETMPKSAINLIEFNSPLGMTDGFNKVIYKVIDKEGAPIYFILISGGLANISNKYGPFTYDENSKTISAIKHVK